MTQPAPSTRAIPALLVVATSLLAACSGASPAPSTSPAPSATVAAAATTAPSASTTSGTATSATATSATAATGPATASTGPSRSRAVPATGSGPALAAAHPTGTATCALLPAATAASLLGGAPGAGTPDPRRGEGGRRQLDGCAYGLPGGAHLAYLVWTLPATVTAADVAQALPGAAAGGQAFDPGLARPSAAAVLARGPVAVQVNAGRGTRLVQVTVSGAPTDRARSVAIAATRALTAG